MVTSGRMRMGCSTRNNEVPAIRKHLDCLCSDLQMRRNLLQMRKYLDGLSIACSNLPRRLNRLNRWLLKQLDAT